MPDARKIAEILSELDARRGYARIRTAATAEEAWREAVGPEFGGKSRPGPVKRGVLEVIVANSMLAHELQFQKEQIVKKLAELLPQEKIRDLRCRIGPVS
jgi:predicted nucleic acid-binding Zn ribbon protein